MSHRSSGSKSRLDPEAMLDDLEDLDYEPDIVEEPDDKNQDSRDQIPEPSGQEFHGSGSSERPPSYGTDLEGPLTEIQSFRDKMNYKDMHFDVEEGSFRSRFGRYSKSDTFNLDSSDDEEDVEPEFSDTDFDRQTSNFDVNDDNLTNYDVNDDEEYNKNFELLADPKYVGPESPLLDPNSQLYYQENNYESDNATYENMNVPRDLARNDSPGPSSMISSQGPGNIQDFVSPTKHQESHLKPKKKPFNVTIQVKGDERHFIVAAPPIKEKIDRPWRTRAHLSGVVSLSSMDTVIPFCPPAESRISTPNLVSQGSDSLRSDSMVGSDFFKVPLKRPPTRQKSSIKSISVSVDPGGKVTVKEAEDNSDIISLIASTNIGDEQEDHHERNPFQIKSEAVSLGRSASATEEVRMNRVAEWVEHAKTLKIPTIYKGLCYRFFFYDSCQNQMCKMSHLLKSPLTRISQLSNLSEIHLSEAYDFAKAYPSFYVKIYQEFAKAFAVQGNKTELKNMVNVIFDCSIKINKVEALKTVFENIMQISGGTFNDTVLTFLVEVGLGRYLTFGEVLLEVLIYKMDNLSSHWPILEKLFNAGEKVPLRFASKFLVELMKPPIDQKVCKEVYKVILQNKCLDLPSVPLYIREPFLKLCTLGEYQRAPDKELAARIDRNLSIVRTNFEQTVVPEVNLNDRNCASGNSTPSNPTDFSTTSVPADFSVPPPNFSAFGNFQAPSIIVNPVARHNQGYNFTAIEEFGRNLNGQQDFAALSRQQPTFPSTTNLNFPEEPLFPNNPDPSHYQFSQPPPTYKRNSRTRNSINSSDDESNSKGIYSDSDSTQDQTYYNNGSSNNRPSNQVLVPTGLTYNREGLQYDPANDYVPPQNRRTNLVIGSENPSLYFNPTEPSVPVEIVSDFDRLRNSEVRENRGHKRVHQGSPRDIINPLPIVNASSPVVEYPPAPKRVKPMEGPVPETLVSSSSNPQPRKEKPPEHPVFGQLYFDPNYEFNVSLHNQYLQKIDNVDIDEDDVHRLNDAVKNGDGKQFLNLVNKYSGPLTVQNFISMTLAHLKGMNQMVARTYKRLLTSIEHNNPYFYGNLKIRVILEVITMNLLFLLEQRNMFEPAKDLLMKFSNWDSLITSRLFITDIHIGVSIVGRYLFFAKILVHSKPELTYEIMVCPTLHLLEEYQKWPYHPSYPIPEIFSSDLAARNLVLSSFLKKGFRLNTVAVTELYKTALRRKEGIWSFEVKPYINPMIVELINVPQMVSLKPIYSEIHLFINFMEKDTLRAFLSIMSKHLRKSDLFKLYEKCVIRNVYQKLITGQVLETNIEIKTNMLVAEIELIILYFFHKLTELRYIPPESLKFHIKLPGESRTNLLPILNSNHSLDQVKQIIQHCLKKRCSVESKTCVLNVVEVDKEELVKFLEYAVFERSVESLWSHEYIVSRELTLEHRSCYEFPNF